VRGYHNIDGQPVDWAVWRERQAEHARKLRAAGVSSRRKPTVKNGYAAPPGTGPDGMTCKDCKHKTTMSNTGNKSWIKCELRRATWTGGEGTDILARSPACSKFEAKA
jgi:hypothetical protein